MSEYLSNRQRKLNVGISSYTENQLVLDVIGNTNISGGVSASSLAISGNSYISGRLGIGKTNPNIALDITTDIGIGRSLFDITNSRGVNNYVLTSTPTGVLWQALTGVGAITGINVAPDNTDAVRYIPFFDVSSPTVAYSYTAPSNLTYNPGTNSFGIGTSDPKQTLQVGVGTYVVVIDDFGNLGVGTENPSSKLTVIGDGFFTGTIFANNFIGNIIASYASTAGVSSLSQGLIGTPNIEVGIVTATEYFGVFNGTIGADVTLDYANNAGIATYAQVSGISTVSQGLTGTPNLVVGIVTANEYYGTFKGTIDTDVTLQYAETAGIATYATRSGIATYSNFSGIATYAQVSGISTVAEGLTGTPNIEVGIVTATEYFGVFKGTIDADVTLDYANNAGIATYAESAGISTVAEGLTGTPNIEVGIVTATEYFGVFKGTIDDDVILQYAETAGIATYSVNAGIATYANLSGIATYAQVSGISTVAEGLTGTPNLVVGIVTATEYFGVFKGTIDADVTLEYAEVAGISTYANFSGIATYANNAGIATNVIGGIGSLSALSVSGISTLTNLQSSNATIQNLTGTSATFTNLNSTGISTFNQLTSSSVFVTGITTSSGGFVGNLTGTATTATNVIGGIGSLSSLSVSGITELSTVEIENLETQNISNSGIITTSNLNVLSGFDVFANSSVFHENVVIQGNLTVNGTEVILNVEEKYIKDKQIVLGFSTTNNENDISANGGGIAIASTEGNPLVSLQRTGINTLPETYKQLIWTSANTFGVGTTDAFLFNYAVGIGSTLVPNGVRLAVGRVQITDNTVNTSFIVGTAATFTKLNVTDLVGSSGSFSGIVTASSGFVGNLTGTATTATNVIGGIASVNSLNVSGISTVGALTGSNAFFSGIVTATAFVGDASGISNVGFASVSGYAPIAGFATYAASSGVSTSVIGGNASVNQLNVSGISTLGVTSTTNLTTQQLNVTGLSTFSGIATYTSSLFGTQASFTGVVTASSFNGNASSATYATSAGIATYADKSGVSTSVIGGIGSITQLQVTGVSTFTNGPVLIGTGTSTGTASQRLQVTGGAYVSGSVGIGTTNPTRNLDINGDVRIRGALYDTNNQSGGVNQVLISTGTGVDWGDVTSSGALTAIGIEEEGTPIGNVTSVNFVGPTVTATVVGSQATVTILDFVSNAGYSTISGVSTSVIGGIASVSQLQVTGVSTITSNSSLDALRINQLGSGNALVVEDETNPDSTPFVISSTGSVGIGTTNPTRNLDINGGIRLRGALYDKDNQPGIANQVLLSTGTGVDWGDITSSGAITAIGIEEEGAPIGNVTSINFVGPNITATVAGAAATITVLDFVGYASTAGIATYANIAGISTNVIGGIASVTSLNVTGVSTLGVTTTTDLTSQNLSVSGIVTATGGFVGNLTGTATTATNLSDAANITAGIINSSRLSGFYNINVSYANTSGISTVAQGLTGTPNITVGIATASSFVGNLTGTATTANNLSDAANITTGTISPSRLSGFYNINVSYASTSGISTVAQGLTGTPDITVGVVTASGFVGNLTGTATTATNLSDAANITTGTINSSRLSGFYNINVSYANTAGISTLSQGLTGTPDIIVGILTASSGNFSGIITSSGLNVSGITTTSVLNVGSGGTIITTTSDGFVGIGTTNPTRNLDINGDVRLRGALYDTNNQTGTLNQVLLSTVNGVDWGDITSSGALTGIVIKDEGTTIGNVTSIDFVGPNVAATVIGAAATVTILDFVSNAGYSTSSGVSTSVIGGIASVTSLNVTGVTTLGVTTTTNLTSQNISVSGITTSTGGFVGNLTGTATTATNLSNAANITTGTIDSARLSGFYNINVSYADTSGIATYANNAGISTNVIGGIASVTSLNVTGVTTLGVTTATNLTTQSLNVSGVTTSSGGFVGNLTGTATTATNLSDAANITAGTINNSRLSGFYNINVSYANTAGISTVSQGLTGTPDIVVGVVTASSGNFSGIVTTSGLNVSGIATLLTNSSSDAFRITQLGSGNALVVEDETTPDSTPFVISSTGSVGIGTTNPTRNLDISGDVRLRGALYDTNNQSGGVNQVLVSTGTGIDWSDITSTGALTSIGIEDEGSLIGNAVSINFVGPNLTATVTGTAATVTILDYVSNAGYSTLSGVSTSVIGGIASVTSLNVTGVSTLGTVEISSGIITATSGVVTYYGDGSNLTGVSAFSLVTEEIQTTPVYLTFVENVGVSTIGISTEKLSFIPSTGSLGIGTVNPTSRLQVDGDVLISGIVTASEFVGNVTASSLSVSGFSTFSNVSVSSSIFDSTNSSGANQYVLSSTPSGILWQSVTSVGAISGINVATSTDNTSFNIPFLNIGAGTTANAFVTPSQFTYNPFTNSVGIGTTSATSKLTISASPLTSALGIGQDFSISNSGSFVSSVSIGATVGAAVTEKVLLRSISRNQGTLDIVSDYRQNQMMNVSDTDSEGVFRVTSLETFTSPFTSPIHKTLLVVGESGIVTTRSAVAIATANINAPSGTVGADIYGNVNIRSPRSSSTSYVAIAPNYRDNGALSFEAPVGTASTNSITQLFSITNNVSSSIFRINDLSRNPILEANVSGNLGIGTTNPRVNLDVASPSQFRERVAFSQTANPAVSNVFDLTPYSTGITTYAPSGGAVVMTMNRTNSGVNGGQLYTIENNDNTLFRINTVGFGLTTTDTTLNGGSEPINPVFDVSSSGEVRIFDVETRKILSTAPGFSTTTPGDSDFLRIDTYVTPFIGTFPTVRKALLMDKFGNLELSRPFTIVGGNSSLIVGGNTSISGIATIGLGSTSSPTSNSTFSFELTNNTTLTVRVRGTDGVTRTGTIALS